MDHSEIKHLPKVDHTPGLDDDGRVLLSAAAMIERDGLSKGCLERPDGRKCLIGAILTVLAGNTEGWDNDTREPHPLYQRVITLAERVHPEMAQWNDSGSTTKDEVVARMRAAALGL